MQSLAKNRNKFMEIIDSEWYQLINGLNTQFIDGSYRFFSEKKIKPALMPITCGSVSSPMGLGSDSLPVKVQLFDKEVYLADSMQFQLEYLLRFNPNGVWYIMPTFRGEDPDETHLNEFFHAEAEIKGNLEDVMQLVEAYVRFITNELCENFSSEIESVAQKFDHVEQLYKLSEFPQITMEEARVLLANTPNCFDELAPGIHSITRKGELELIKVFGGIVWLTHPRQESIPFYQATDITNKYGLSADLLMGVGETIGCGERHQDSLSLTKSIISHNVDPSEYAWYVDMKEHTPIQTSGFGMGIERYFLWLLNSNDIRDIPIMKRIKGSNYYP